MSKAPRHRRPLIEALEPRLLFSATADIAVFDDGHSDGQYLAYAAQNVDLVSIYKPDDALDSHPLMMQTAQPDNPQIDTVIFVDTAVDNYQALVNDIEKNVSGQSVAIVYLDATKEGLAQISDYLAGASGISAVHIISHGVAGSVQLGNQVINENNLAQHQQSLASWKNSLHENADILFYGCDLAANQSGMNLLRQFSDLTGADVAASNDLTGNAANADWELEARVGQIETASIFSSNQNMEWQGVLADVVHLYSGVATNEQIISAGGDVKQGVQLTSTQTVDRIQVMLANHGTSSASVQMTVHEHSYNGTVVASASVSTGSLGNSLGWVNFDFAHTTFNAYTVYWIEFRTNDGADNLVGIGYINSHVIASEFVVNNSGDSTKDMAIALVDVGNRAPTVANAITDQAATEGVLFGYTFAANTFNDQDGDTLTYTATLANGDPLPAWLGFNAGTRTFSGVPDDGDVGTISVKVTANDGKGGSVDDTFNLVINNVNDDPVLNNPVPNQNATEDAAFNYTFPANTFGDADVGTSFTYTAELAGGGALPAWLNFDSATRTFSGTPTNADVGTISVRLIANDGAGGTVNDTFDIAIANTNDAPTVANAIANQTATENALFNYTFPVNTFNDPDVGDSLTYSATLAGGGALPAWLTFDAVTRTFSGTPQNSDVGTISIEITASDGAAASVSDTFDIVIGNADDSPVLVNPIPNQNATEDVAYNFQFSDTTFDDPDLGDTLTYTATMADGSPLPGWLNFNAATRTFSGTPSNADVGTISIRVTADDGNGGTPATDTFDMVIANSNDAPTIANAIPNQNATEDSAFNFTFAANTFADQDVGATLTYSAQLTGGAALPAWLVFDAATRTFSGTPTNAHVGVLSVDVIANDSNGGTVTDTFTLTVANTNDAPTVANAIADQNATEDAAFNFQFAGNTFADQDTADTLIYSAQLAGGGALPSWLSFNAATRTFSGTPANGDVGSFSVDVIASDGNGGSVTDTFSITVANVNDAPSVSIALPDYYTNEQTAVNLHGTGITVSDVDTNTVTLTIAGPAPHSELTASEGATGVNIVSGNGTPSLVISGTLTQVNDFLAGNNGGTLTYRLSGDTPMSTATLTITANDGALTGNDTTTINIAAINDAPLNSVPPAQVTTEDTALVFSAGNSNQIQINDVDVASGNLEVTLSVTNGTLTLAGTTGLSFTTGDGTADANLVFTGSLADINAALATLTFNPIANYSGAAVLSIITSDLGNTGAGGTLTDTDNVNITISAANDAPTVANIIPNQNATQNAAFNFQFAANTFADADVGDTLTYSAQLAGGGALPAWLSFDPVTRTFSGTPANGDLGTVSIDVIADDGNGGTATDTFNLVVAAGVNNLPTVANAIPNQSATEDTAFNFQFAANTFNDADVGNTLTYTAQLAGGASLPAWLSFDSATRTFSGIPLNANVGTISIEVIADDGNGGTVTDTFDILVANTNDAPTVANAIPNQNATENAAFNFQFAANTFADADVVDTLTYSAQLAGGGALPAWLSFDAITRTFSGTPAVADVGTLNINVTASDGNGGSVTDTFALVVSALPVNLPPVVQAGISDQTVNEDSGFQFTIPGNAFNDVEGDALVYSVQLVGGGDLPAWLSFDATTRTFSGTPTNSDVGIMNLQVSVSDGNGGSASDNFSITVVNTNDAPTLNAPLVEPRALEDTPFTLGFPMTMFNDVDVGDSLSYSAQLTNGQPLPDWLGFDANSLTFSGTPGNNDVGSLSIQMIATDGEASVSFQFLLRVDALNDAPVANIPASINNIEDAAGDQLDLFAVFSDEETPAQQLQYSVVNNSNPALVTGATIDANNGKLIFTYGANQFGSSDLTIRAQDANGAWVDTPLRINIAPVNDTPVSKDIADISVSAGAAPQQLDLRNIFSDIEDGSSLKYTLIANTNTTAVPQVQWNQATGMMTIAFASASGGESFITLRAQDSEGAWVDTRFKVTVSAPPVIPEPEVPARPPVTPPPVTPPPVTPPTAPPVTEVPTTPPTTPPTNGGDPDTGGSGVDVPLPDIGIEPIFPGAPETGVPPLGDAQDPRDNFMLPNDKSSRDYERIEAELEAQNIPVTTLTASSSLVSLISTDAGFAPWEVEEFNNEVRRIREQMDVAMEEDQDRRAVVAGLTFSVTTGLLVWSLRASSLLLTLMSMLPLWRGLDPLPILDEVNKRKKELEQQRKDRAREDKSSKEVGYLFDHAQHKQPGQ